MTNKTLRNESTPEGRGIWDKVDKAASRAPKAVIDKMNRLTHEQIDAMGPDELAEGVATRVMGWKQGDDFVIGDGNGSMAGYVLMTKGGPEGSFFSPATDANDDLRIIDYIKRLFSIKQIYHFDRFLAIANEKRNHGVKNMPSGDGWGDSEWANYQPGDYARAALHAVVEMDGAG